MSQSFQIEDGAYEVVSELGANVDRTFTANIGYTGTVSPNDRLGVAYTHPALSRHNCSAGVKTSLTAPAIRITLSGAGIIFCTNLILESIIPIDIAIGS